jgi:class 3 adenylate cyclase
LDPFLTSRLASPERLAVPSQALNFEWLKWGGVPMELAADSRQPHPRERTRGIGLRGALSLFLMIIVIISVVAVTLVTYLQARRLAREEIRERLLTAAGTAALIIDVERHAKIPLDKKQPHSEYKALQAQLREIQKRIPDARYVYTFRLNKNNKMVFVGDSDDTQFKSQLGEVYAHETPAMRAAFVSGATPIAESEFAMDRWGVWLSGYAPLVRRNGVVEGIVGIDIAAKQVRELEKQYLIVGLISSLLISIGLMPLLYYATHTVTRPLFRMAAELRRLRDFDLNSSTLIKTRIRELNDLNNALESARVGLRSFKKYIPGDVASELVSSRVEAKLGAKKRELTLLFTDFEGFTSLGEKLPPDELVQLLNLYFEAITRAIEQYQGTVDKFIGDSVMAFWNAPSNIPNHPELACRAALRIAERVRALNNQRAQQGLVGLNIRIGLHTGIAMVGNIGHEGRLSYTAIGDVVNMASRIEALNKKYETSVLISASTAERLGPSFQTRHLEDVVLKGKSKPVALYELQGERIDPRDEESA